MNQYKIQNNNFDLEETLTCGQTFCWHRTEGKLYETGKNQFYTFRKEKPIILTEKEDHVKAETELPIEEVKKALGLNHDLESIFQTFPKDPHIKKAKEELWGLRIVQDEPFPCLISYLCSPQMRIPRIKQMHNKICRNFGEQVKYKNQTFLKFPTIEQLSKASEEELRELGVGYRAKYIVESTKMLAEGEVDLEKISQTNYSHAKEEIKQLYGVGDKVADCVLLFSMNFLEAYPVDTWAEKVIKEHYPQLHSENNEILLKNLRNHFGSYSGYAQEYLFHAARQKIITV